MYDRHAHYGYRNLTTEEQASAERAILWLAHKRLRSHDIAMLTDKMLERESKTLCVAIEKGRLIFNRRIRYADTDFDLYLTETLPCLKVQKWLFPNLCFTGRNPSFGFHVHVDAVENFMQNHRKTVLLKREQYDTIESSTTKSNIKTKIMVGRRIALRA